MTKLPSGIVHRFARGFSWVFTVLLAIPTAESSAAPRRSPDVARESAALEAARERWRRFESAHGRWGVVWNTRTGSPHRAMGKGIALAGFANDAPSVDRAVRRFVAAHAELFEAPDLETVAVRLVGSVWHARFRQRLGGIPVRGADWEFRVGAQGGLFMFGADVHRGTPPALAARRIGLESARRAASAEAAPAAGISIEGVDRVELLPVGADGYRLVYDVRVRTSDPRGHWAHLVDATSGEIVESHDLVRRAIDGRVTADVHPSEQADAYESRALPDLRVAVGAETVYTDSTGRFASVSAAGPIGFGFRGRYCDVARLDGPNSSASTPAPGAGTYDHHWNDGNSQEAERDVYSHLNFAHALIRRLDPTFTGIDHAMPCSINASACNTSYDGRALFFALPTPGFCSNTGVIATIVHHEYAHAIQYEVFRAASNDPLAIVESGTISEGGADIYSALISGDPISGRGYYGPGSWSRNAAGIARWPEDRSNGNDYVTGAILVNAFWDLGVELGLEPALRLLHFAQYGMPDDPDPGVAMSELFVETLVADDDDADLSNGTPNLAAILRSFNAHGIGTDFFFTIDHTPITERADAPGGIAFEATIRYAGPFGALDPSSPRLHYSIDGLDWQTVALAAQGGDRWTASIAPPGGALIRYFLEARDDFGGSARRPGGAPLARPFAFVYGTHDEVFADDMETDRGWTVGVPSDDATSGFWVRAEPRGVTFFDPTQPEFDHSPDPAQLCWVTGNTSLQVNGSDVDGGRTSLSSPVFDASHVANPMVEYYRWYFNRAVREPESDFWSVYLSNDGGATWAVVEHTTHTEARWERILFRIDEYLPPTSQMRMRFVARDSLGASSVEGALDDFRVFGSVSTPALLAHFDAVETDEGIRVRWALADPGESEAVLERSEDLEVWAEVLDPEVREGELSVVVDRAARRGVATSYRLSVFEAGEVQRFGPITVRRSGGVLPGLTHVGPVPAAGEVRVAFALATAGHARVRVLDVTGREVARIADGRHASGTHERRWSPAASRAPAGVYFVELEAAGSRFVRRLLVVR